MRAVRARMGSGSAVHEGVEGAEVEVEGKESPGEHLLWPQHDAVGDEEGTGSGEGGCLEKVVRRWMRVCGKGWAAPRFNSPLCGSIRIGCAMRKAGETRRRSLSDDRFPYHGEHASNDEKSEEALSRGQISMTASRK